METMIYNKEQSMFDDFLCFFKRLFTRNKQSHRLVCLETPYAGNVDLNVRYARECMKDCLQRGEYPFASHLLYTQPHILNDKIKEERALGMNAGFAWARNAKKSVFYVDLGVSDGMVNGVKDAMKCGRDFEIRRLSRDALQRVYAEFSG